MAATAPPGAETCSHPVARWWIGTLPSADPERAGLDGRGVRERQILRPAQERAQQEQADRAVREVGVGHEVPCVGGAQRLPSSRTCRTLEPMKPTIVPSGAAETRDGMASSAHGSSTSVRCSRSRASLGALDAGLVEPAQVERGHAREIALRRGGAS